MIATAVQKTPQSVAVYDERGSYRLITGKLLGYTSQTVTVKPLSASNTANIYDDKGKCIRVISI